MVDYLSVLSVLGLPVIILTGGVVSVGFVYRIIWGHLYNKVKHSQSVFSDTFLQAIKNPAYGLLFLIWVDSFLKNIPKDWKEYFTNGQFDNRLLLSVGISIFILIVFNNYLSNIQKKIMAIEKNQVLENSAAWVSACKLGRLVSILIFLIVFLSVLDVPMAQILAPTAVGALALSFASKDVLSNVFGGIMVMCDRPFAVGDYITIANSDEGTVRYIGWRMTEIQLQNGRILHVPNGLVTTAMVTNYSEKTHWFVQKEVGLRYSDLLVVDRIAEEIEEWVCNHELSNRRRAHFARLFNLSDSCITIRVRVYLKSSISTKQWYMFTQQLLLFIHDTVKKHGADFAFPTRTLMLDESAPLSVVSSEGEINE